MSILNLNHILFVEQFPKLDLHGFDRESARVAINDFIKDNLLLKNEFFLIIHGIGSGILLKTTQETLKRNRHILQYRLHYMNPGCTIVQLRFDK